MDRGARLEDTVFSGMLVTSPQRRSRSPRRNSPSESDTVVEQLRETFTPRHSGAAAARARRSQEAVRRRQTRKSVLDNRTAQNFEIVLKKLPISAEDLRLVVERMDFGAPLQADELERLREALPGPDVLRPLLEFKGDSGELRSVERHLLKLATIDRLGPRLHVLALKKSLLGRRQQLLQDTNSVRSACQELKESKLLKDFLEAVLIMFNFVNHGTEKLEKDTVHAFDITSAIRIAEFKAVGLGAGTGVAGENAIIENFTGLHFCVTQVLSKTPNVTSADVVKEFRSLGAGAGLNLRMVSRDAAELLEEARFLERELGEFRGTYESAGSAPTVRAKAPGRPPAPAGSERAREGTSELRVSGEELALLSPVPEESSARLRHTLSLHHSFVVASPRGIWDRLRGCVVGAVEHTPPPGAVWLREVSLGAQGARPATKWRRVRLVAASHLLEVHSTAKVRTFALPGMAVEPLENLLLPFSFQLRGATAANATPHTLLRCACDTAGELERWLHALRQHARFAGAGWLERLQPGTVSRRASAERHWYTLDPAQGALVAYRDAEAQTPVSTAQLAEVGREVVPLSRAGPGEVALQAFSDKPWAFAVRGAGGDMLLFAAPDKTALDLWLQVLKPAPAPAPIPEEPPQVLKPAPSLIPEEPPEVATTPRGEDKEPATCSTTESPVSPIGGFGFYSSPSSSSRGSSVSPSRGRSCPAPAQPCGSSTADIAAGPDTPQAPPNTTPLPPRSRGPMSPKGPMPLPLISPKQPAVQVSPLSPHNLISPKQPTVPVLNLQNLGGGLTEPTRERRRSIASSLDDMDTGSEAEDSTTESCSHAGSQADSRTGSVASYLPGSEVHSEAGNSSAREPMLRRLERLKENAHLAEIEVRGAVKEACEQASNAMLYFGQVPPPFDEDIAPFANALQNFLQKVNQLILEVVSAWKEIEQQQQARLRRGEEFKFQTPRNWTPLSARGVRARKEKAALLTLD